MARKSHLYAFHKQNSKLTDFSGFKMPLWYKGIVDEYYAVRNSAGLFDVSHMGRFSIKGSDATDLLNTVVPSNVSKVKESRAFYSTICNETGGIVDDTVTDKISRSEYLMVVNAANRQKDLDWVKKIAKKFSVQVADVSESTALLALQGPTAAELLQRVCDADLTSIKRFGFAFAKVLDYDSLVSRTGYTGEDGFEIAIFDCPVDAPEKAERVWKTLLDLGRESGVLPCGLGARDLLRLEAGLCLYGQDMDESTTPIEASIPFVVDREKGIAYIGRGRIEEQLENGTGKRRTTFSMERGIPRHGYPAAIAGESIGTVTSGSFSPILKRGIGMAYVPEAFAEPGSSFSVKIREQFLPAVSVKTPFYDTTKYGYSRRIMTREDSRAYS